VLYPQNRHLSARVRAFVQYLAEAVAPSTRITRSRTWCRSACHRAQGTCATPSAAEMRSPGSRKLSATAVDSWPTAGRYERPLRGCRTRRIRAWRLRSQPTGCYGQLPGISPGCPRVVDDHDLVTRR